MSSSKNSSKGRSVRPIGIDLFAGAGGLSLGFEQAGFDVVAAVEIDPIHCAVHKFNFPNTKIICKSVASLTGEELLGAAGKEQGQVDVVFGGAPCQGFSMIGKRALDDPRNELVFHFVRLVKEVQPKYFVFENVKGLTVGAHKRFLQELIEALDNAGYDVERNYQVLNAAEYGVPQDRRRLFLMGVKKGGVLPAYPKPTVSVSVREALGDLPNADDYPSLLGADSTKARFKKGAKYSRILRGLERDAEDYGYQRQFDADMLTSSMRTEHTDLSIRRFERTSNGETEPISRFHKLDPDGVCNTLRAGTGSDRGAFTSPRPIHYKYPRVITVREAARLHSYPDWFRLHVTKWHGFRQIGNSVPPLLGRAVAREILRALGVNPVRPGKPQSLGDVQLLGLKMAEAARVFEVPADVVGRRLRRE